MKRTLHFVKGSEKDERVCGSNVFVIFYILKQYSNSLLVGWCVENMQHLASLKDFILSTLKDMNSLELSITIAVAVFLAIAALDSIRRDINEYIKKKNENNN